MGVRISITGMGICSAIGNTLDDFAASLRSGASGVKEQPGLFEKQRVWAGLVSMNEDPAPGVDRAALLAHHAAHAAWSQAVNGGIEFDPGRVALMLGTSHGGRSQIDLCLESQEKLESDDAAQRILHVSPHFRQTEWVARRLGVHGPVSTISTACSSGSAAILHGIDLLQAGKADFVLAGGMDGFSKLTHAGFQALGAVADGACGPFSERVGISLGEGAAVVVMERLDDAQARNAFIWAEIYSGGSSWDCYHLTEPHPSGEGLLRALQMASERSCSTSLEAFGYASLHGTGTRANDAAETIAVKRFFLNGAPPVSSIKSFTGHTLGASGAMGLIASVLGMTEGFLPPTVNFQAPRAGCDLDYVPNEARPSKVHSFVAQSAGFGGVNLVLMGGRERKASSSAAHPGDRSREQVVISGMGVVSPAGVGLTAYRESLLAGKVGIGPIDRFDVSDRRTRIAGLVRDFSPRKLAPTLNVRRADLCFQYAAIAVAEALADSKLFERDVERERVGLVVGTTRGAVTSFERCMRSALDGAWHETSALHFPNLVMSSLGGYVSNMFQLKGVASTLVCSSGGGLQTIIQAYELLRGNQTQKAVVVVVADELSPLFYRYFDQAGDLEENAGRIMGEGAAAFVLERKTAADSDELSLFVNGYGMTSDSDPRGGVDNQGAWLAKSIHQALCDARLAPSEIDLIFGHGAGRRCGDTKELAALARVLDKQTPLCCVLPNTGFAESASAGFSLAAAGLCLHHQEAYQTRRKPALEFPWNFLSDSRQSPSPISNVLITGSSDSGNNAALIVSRRPLHRRHEVIQ